ncbi:MAG TPA: hypothetical protein V6C96_04040 [Vampirovibrionales bacterium]
METTSNRIKHLRLICFLLLVVLTLPYTGISRSDTQNFSINHADSLEILDTKLVLKGNVSVKTSGQQAFVLKTNKLIAKKNKQGEFSEIECFGRSSVKSQQFVLIANKLNFYKQKNSKEFDLVKATGNVQIDSYKDSQKVKAQKVDINLSENKLYAYSQVSSEQIIENKNKKQKVVIESEKQIIDLNENPDRSNPQKKLIATQNVRTLLENDADIKANKATIFMAYYQNKWQSRNALFEGAVDLKTADGTKATGDELNYFFAENKLIINSKLQGKSFLSVPFEEKKEQQANINNPLETGNKKKQSFMTIKADYIENIQIDDKRSILKAYQKSAEELVELNYGTKKGWGNELFIKQNKDTNKNANEDDYLLLTGEAKILDTENQQLLESSIIKIGLEQKDLQAGFTSRSRGFLPSKSMKTNEKKKDETTYFTPQRKLN